MHARHRRPRHAPGAGNGNGLDRERLLRHHFPNSAIVICCVHAPEEFVTAALRVGALAYLIKGAVPAELEAALRAIHCRETS